MKCKYLILLASMGFAAFLSGPSPALAASAPPLGPAGSFGILGGTTVTNTGLTIVTGDLGVSPGTAVTGFPPGIFTGTLHLNDAVAMAAQNAITTAYNALKGQPCDVDLTGTNLGGLTLVPGVYCFSSSAQLTGILTLNGLGNPDAVWVFQIGSTLTTATGSSVVFIDGGRACGAFWQVGSSATIGVGTKFVGNILALASIGLDPGATSSGALFARNGAVTLSGFNTVSVCGSGSGGGCKVKVIFDCDDDHGDGDHDDGDHDDGDHDDGDHDDNGHGGKKGGKKGGK